MFVHQQQLEHRLRPSDYYQPDVLENEVANLFRPGWHFLAAVGELPRDGDFKTIELLGVPLIVRNFAGEIRAFLNVCPHRHARLSSVSRGHDERFRCQYHGWEYDREGRTGKIPDARCFRPWDRENACLVRYPTETIGGMVYISLDANPVPLNDYLGEFAKQAEAWFAPPFQFTTMWTLEYEANWKIIVENSLESYHIPCLHQKSFGIMPPESDCDHILNDRFTTFHTAEPSGWVQRYQNFMVRSLGITPRNIYTHHHHHPNLIFISMDVMRMAQLMIPISPTRTRHTVWIYTLTNQRRWSPIGWWHRRLLSWLVVRIARQIVGEDAPIFPEVQEGMKHSPHRGVLGTREERLFYFQRYVADRK